jgi:DNA replication protein DnaC
VNLLFRGGTGLGKTFLSACIARVVSDKGYSVVYETTVAALAAFESQKFHSYQEDASQADERVRQLMTCELLILDDLGTEMVTEFSKSALYTLINTRLLNGKKTVISTNLTEADMERLYTPQICSRLRGEYQDLPFVGTDIRKLRKERGL